MSHQEGSDGSIPASTAPEHPEPTLTPRTQARKNAQKMASPQTPPGGAASSDGDEWGFGIYGAVSGMASDMSGTVSGMSGMASDMSDYLFGQTSVADYPGRVSGWVGA